MRVNLSLVPRIVAICFMVLAVLLAWRQQPPPLNVEFIVDKPVENSSMLWHSFQISDDQTVGKHAAVIVSEPEQGEIVFWFGGSKEAARDVQIFRTQIKSGEQIDTVQVVMSPARLGQLSGRYVKMLGNPVVWYQGEKLMMALVAVSAGGWATSRIDLLSSYDHGLSFTFEQTLKTSPFFNISSLVRNPPVPVSNGFLLPAYFEMHRYRPQWVLLSEQMELVSVTTSAINGLQPVLLVQGKEQAKVLMRPPEKGHIESAELKAGWHLAAHAAQLSSEVSNPSSALDVIKVADSTWLMAHNIGENRKVLALSLSTDNGETWLQKKFITHEGSSPAYPALSIGEDGFIHLVYSVSKKAIYYQRFTLKALQALPEVN